MHKFSGIQTNVVIILGSKGSYGIHIKDMISVNLLVEKRE